MVNEAELNDLMVLILGTLITVLTVCALIYFAFIYQRKIYKKEIQFKEIEKLLKKEELKSAYSFIEGREKERKQISEDLHDNIGSLLATLRLYIDRLKEEVVSVENNDIINKIISILSQTSDETRRLSHELGTGNQNQFGLEMSIYNLCDVIKASKKLNIICIISISNTLENEVALNIYRIIQEMFSNTLKHANANNVRLEISQILNEYISIIYEDNGQGFNQENSQKGIGLKNIESRINILSGTLTIDSTENQGTTFNIEIPISNSYG